jgi:plastocyanin
MSRFRRPSPALNPATAEDPVNRRPLIALLATAGLPLLAGCGSEAPGPAAAAATATPAAAAPAKRAAASSVVVELSASQFSPATLDADVGELITFVNRDAVAHTATAAAGAGFDSGAMEQGAAFTFTPGTAGVISLVCTFHPGMTGAITVS